MEGLSKSLESIEYPTRFYPQQSPIHLCWIAALNNVAAPPLRDFTYCEVGSGTGLTSYVLAAANPKGRFVAIDASAQHVDRTSQLIEAGEVSNLRVEAADIASYADLDLPNFDYIVAHGFYTWVGPAIQQAFRCFVDAHLAPGGIVLLSYNALPGWSGATPIRDYFRERVNELNGDVLERTAHMVRELSDLAALDPPIYTDCPVTARVIESLLIEDPRYVAHEFLGAANQPLYFSQVNQKMAALGLQYLGDAQVRENAQEHGLSPPLDILLQGIASRQIHETRRDFIRNRYFRNDLYIRDPIEAPDGNPFLQTLVTVPASGTAENAVKKLTTAIVELLDQQALSGGEVVATMTAAGFSTEEVIQALRSLALDETLTPQTEPFRDFNEHDGVLWHLETRNRPLLDADVPEVVLASPVTGSRVPVSSAAADWLRAGCQLGDNPDLISHRCATLARLGIIKSNVGP